MVNGLHLYSAFILSAVHLYSAFILSAVHLYSAFILSAVHLYSAFILSAVHLYSGFILSAVHLYSAFILSAVHLYSAFIQSAVQCMPLIHPFTHTFTHQRRLAAMQGTNQLVRSNRGFGVSLRDTSTRPGWDRTGNPPTASHIAPLPPHENERGTERERSSERVTYFLGLIYTRRPV